MIPKFDLIPTVLIIINDCRTLTLAKGHLNTEKHAPSEWKCLMLFLQFSNDTKPLQVMILPDFDIR